MRNVGNVKLSDERDAKVYYGWHEEYGGDVLSLRIEALPSRADGGLDYHDQMTILDAVRDALRRAVSRGAEV
jgi:hypothetical protein